MINFTPHKGKKTRPQKLMFYGGPGLGKSSIAGIMPDPIFINLEDRLAHLNVASLPLCRQYHAKEESEDSFMHQLGWILKSDQKYKTLVIDTCDWLETLIHAHVCKENKVDDFSEFSHGKGYVIAQSCWQDVVYALSMIQEAKNMHIVITSHCHTTLFSDPSGNAWDMYSPKLTKGANAKLIEWMDYIFFIRQKVATKSLQEGFGKKEKAASTNVGTVLLTRNNPTYVAKCSNINIPDEFSIKDSKKYLDMLCGVSITESEKPNNTED